MTRRPGLIAIAAAAAALLSGCGSSVKHSTQTITLNQAEQRLTNDMNAVVAALPVKPRLVPVSGSGGVASGACSKDLEDASNGKYHATLQYFLRDVPADRNTAVFDAVRDFATKHAYHPYSIKTTFTSYTDKDGFGIELNENDAQSLALTVSAPCVWPNGTPPPS